MKANEQNYTDWQHVIFYGCYNFNTCNYIHNALNHVTFWKACDLIHIQTRPYLCMATVVLMIMSVYHDFSPILSVLCTYRQSYSREVRFWLPDNLSTLVKETTLATAL